MKSYLLRLLTFSVAVFSYVSPLYSQSEDGDYFVVYVDSVCELSPSYVNARNRLKERKASALSQRKTISRSSSDDTVRITSRLGGFKVKCLDGFFITDGVRHCIRMAIDTWENYVGGIVNPIEFFMELSEDMDDEIAVTSTTGYSVGNRIAIPDNLYHQQYTFGTNYNDVIQINAYADWNTSWPYDDTYGGAISLTNSLLRHIAHILGFGTSIKYNIDGNLKPATGRFFSMFDRMTYNGTNYLNEIGVNGFSNFFQSPINIYSPNKFNYPLYTTLDFCEGKTGCYFSLGVDDLMDYPFMNEELLHPISHRLLNVLDEVGWDIKEHDVTIECDSTDVLGYGSVYNTLHFTAKDNASCAARTGQWKYQLFDNDNEVYVDVCTGSGYNFAVTPQLVEAAMDEFGCVQARVSFESANKTYTLPLSLESRPVIDNISIVRTENNSNNYSLAVSLDCKGSTSGRIRVTNAGSTRTYNINGNTTNIGSLVSGYNAYIDITLYNDYGTANRMCKYTYSQPSGAISNNSYEIIALVNGSVSATDLRHDDKVELQLFGLPKDVAIDSVVWKMDIRSRGGNIATERLNDNTVQISPSIFSHYFYRGRYTGWPFWGKTTFVEPDSCTFYCDVYMQGNKEKVCIKSNQKFYLDLLPEIHCFEVSDAYYDEFRWCYAIFNFNIDCRLYDYGVIYTYADGGPSGGVSVQFPFEAPFLNTEPYYIYVAQHPEEITTEIYLQMSNAYGSAFTDIMRLTDDMVDAERINAITSTSGNNHKISIQGGRIYVECEQCSDLSILSPSGATIANVCNTRQYSTNLTNGIYILSVRDGNNNIQTHKFIIR